MSLCDTCSQPGRCCTNFNLSGAGGYSLTFWDDDRPHFDRFPFFVPLYRSDQWTVEGGPETGRTYSSWRWGCTNLGDNGRCLIYEDRPQLCRDYQPAQDGLCAEFKGIPIVKEETCAT